ncbi:MAG TPA: hypothetical protein VKG86_07755 [Terracidiphilus sp.]|nr:hypothetical protein [Terracidiphilus sp.]
MTVIQTANDKAYRDFHQKVADACVALMSGYCKNHDGSMMSDLEIQSFFQNSCSYEEEFKEGFTPEQVADAQWEAIT